MTPTPSSTPWDFSPAIDLLRALSLSKVAPPPWSPSTLEDASEIQKLGDAPSLGNFGRIFDFIEEERTRNNPQLNAGEDLVSKQRVAVAENIHDSPSGQAVLHTERAKEKFEVVSSETFSSSNLGVWSKRRPKPKSTAGAVSSGSGKLDFQTNSFQDSTTESESENDLEQLRRSPNRTAVIQTMLRPLSGKAQGTSPPSSPSPPKSSHFSILKRERPTPDRFRTPFSDKVTRDQSRIVAIDGFNIRERRLKLIASLCQDFPEQSQMLLNPGMLHSSFHSLNTDASGVHVFVDISNIMIGFHNCLKLARGIPVTDRVLRVPMSFHNLAIVLERGRPAAKRVLVGSDRYEAIDEAKQLGYEVNILERVHKAKEPAPRQRRFRNDHTGLGASSGSETIQQKPAPERWVEQAVDEILHLKILESIIDTEKPATMVLATGDAAEAEYSAGFMRMVERALQKGWMVELVSFKLNTSGAYKRKDFRARWGPMFQWAQLDRYVELLLEQS